MLPSDLPANIGMVCVLVVGAVCCAVALAFYLFSPLTPKEPKR